MARLGRGGQRHHHHHACADEEKYGRVGRAVERSHHEAVRVARSGGHIVLIRCQTAERHTDEVNQVIAGKGHGKGERAGENHHFQHIDFQYVEQLHKHCRDHETHTHDQQCVGRYPFLYFGSHECEVLGSFEQKEVDDGGDADAAVDAYLPFQAAAVLKREYRACQKLHYRTENEGYRH